MNKEESYNIFSKIFDENGNFNKKLNFNNDIYNLIFNDNGNTKVFVKEYILEYIKSKNFAFPCDVMKLYYSNNMDNCTKGCFNSLSLFL